MLRDFSRFLIGSKSISFVVFRPYLTAGEKNDKFRRSTKRLSPLTQRTGLKTCLGSELTVADQGKGPSPRPLILGKTRRNDRREKKAGMG